MAEIAQMYSGTVTVVPLETPELTPVLVVVTFQGQNVPSTLFYLGLGIVVTEPDGTEHVGDGVPHDNLVVDLAAPPTEAVIGIRNDGDETIDVSAMVFIDGRPAINDSYGGIPAGWFNPWWASHILAPSELAAGSHTIGWMAMARKSGTSEWIMFNHAGADMIGDPVMHYHCYTTAMNARSSSVSFLQDGTEKEWLIGNETGFTSTGIQLLSNLATKLRFALTNPGDESVRIYVAYSSGAVYPTGVLIDDAPLAMMIDYIDLAPGETGTLETLSFVPTTSFAVSFVIMRERLTL